MIARRRRWERARNYLPYAVLLAPAVLFYTVFGILPVFRAIYTSTTDWSGLTSDYHFIGLANYVTLFQDSGILWTFQATMEYTLAVTVLQNILSVVLAFILNQKLLSRNVLRSMIFMPTLFSGLIIGYIWSFLYSEPIMELGKALHNDVLGNNILGSKDFAIFAAAFMDIWRGTGYTMVIYIAGLQSIPAELEDAASIDGANVLARFRYLALPLLAPATTVCVILTFERCLKNFDSIFALTAGGPGDATMVMAINIYRQSFYFVRAGYGTAIGVTLFAMILILSLLQLRFFRRGEEHASL